MTTPSQGNEILIDTPDSVSGVATSLPAGQALTSWVVGKVERWEQVRDQGYGRLWAEYWRLWRGKWSEDDKNRSSERSRLIAPALAQAIEMTVSELEEAAFSREVWFDITDDIDDKDKVDALSQRDILLEDLDNVNAKDAISETLLNAAIFGTGIIKINTYVRQDTKLRRNADTSALEAYGDDRVYVCLDAIRPDQFIPDPSGLNVPDMLGCAHRARKPLHSILEKIEQGVYREDALGQLAGQQRSDNRDIDPMDPQSQLSSADADECDVIEYHGKVPLRLLSQLQEQKTALDAILAADGDYSGEDELVEAIVTIANKGTLLRAMANPFTMRDRSIIAFQFEKVPGRFWGRGVAEKGYNPQKALDSEIRARIDALGYISAPMLGVDSGRVPRGFKMEIKPGKVWLTQGSPSDVLQPIKVGEINAATFNQASEMERMVQMGTGAFDTASALKSQSASGSNSLSANSMLMGAFVKRAKRAIANVDRNLLTPIIKKTMWRYMQFAPQRYKKDYTFQVKATLGITAREVEAMQMTQLVGMIPEQFGPVQMTLVQGIIEHTALPNKAQILQQVNQALQPPSPEDQKKAQELKDLQHEAVKAQAQGELLKNQKTLAEIQKLLAEAKARIKEADLEDERVAQEYQRLNIQMQENQTFQDQNSISLAKLHMDQQALNLKEREVAVKERAPAKPAKS
jgi:hypothetical protein